MKLRIPALRSRNYQLFFVGQGISLIGTWMTQVATLWLVYQLTHSALMLGVVGFSSQVPSFILAPFGGVVVDRLNPHRILVITQLLAMMQSLALAGLTLTAHITIALIIGLSFCQGLINAFDAPARQTLAKDIVERPEDLASAIALNSSLVNGGRLVGPALAGAVIAQVGVGYCFLIDGVSYIAVIAGLLAMRLRLQPKVVESINPLLRIKAGFEYGFGFPPLRAILLLLSVFSFTAMPFATLLPIVATQELHGDAHTLGSLMAASGVGALVGGVYLSTRPTVLGLGRVIATAPLICGVGMIAFSLSHVLWTSLLMSAVIGLGSILQVASSNTVIQTIVDDDKRGRVMSLFIMAFLGVVPFGNLWAGSLATYIGVPWVLALNGGICIVGALVFSRQLPVLRGLVRPIYIKAGILPQMEPHA